MGLSKPRENQAWKTSALLHQSQDSVCIYRPKGRWACKDWTSGDHSCCGRAWCHCWEARCDCWAWTRSWCVCTGCQNHSSLFYSSRNAEGREHFWEQASTFFFVWYRCWKNTAELLLLVPVLFKATLQQRSRKERKSLSPLNSRRIVSPLHQNLWNRNILRRCFLCKLCPRKAGQWVGTEGSRACSWDDVTAVGGWNSTKLSQAISTDFLISLSAPVSPSNDIYVLSLPNCEDLRQHKRLKTRGKLFKRKANIPQAYLLLFLTSSAVWLHAHTGVCTIFALVSTEITWTTQILQSLFLHREGDAAGWQLPHFQHG